MSVKLIEANEEIEFLRRQLEARAEEIERLKKAEASANDRVIEAQRKTAQLKSEVEGARRKSDRWREPDLEKINNKLLLADYQTALSKYRTWMRYAERQLNTMKTLLEELGGWTEQNRYKVYFSYRDILPEQVEHEHVSNLAAGSILAYIAAIEDVENISATQTHPKFRTVTTQTDASKAIPELTLGSQAATPDAQQSSALTVHELKLINCEREIEHLEVECAQQRERIIILNDRTKHVELLEEQKAGLQMKTDILMRQNQQLINEHERLKSMFSGGAISRNNLEELVVSSKQLKERNLELEAKQRQLEAHRESLTTAESRRIAQLFKRKYESEIANLQAKLNKYEPPHDSDTTRILRFAACNPLDEAHEELVIREVASAATKASSSKTTQNPLKRRKLDNSREENDQEKELMEENEVGEKEMTRQEMGPIQLHQMQDQIETLKEQMQQNEKRNADFLQEYREVISLLSGYNVQLGEEGFCEVENVHSKDCVFLFQKHNLHPPAVDLLDNDCARRWKDIIENYLVRYNSVPAFLSAVTISLVESPEEFISSSQKSQQSTSSSS